METNHLKQFSNKVNHGNIVKLFYFQKSPSNYLLSDSTYKSFLFNKQEAIEAVVRKCSSK